MPFSVRYGGKKGKRHDFKIASDMVAIRLNEGQSFEKVMRKTHSPRELASLSETARFDDANVVVMRTPAGKRGSQDRDAVRKILKPAGVRFAGRVLRDARSQRPVLYTENYFVKFSADIRTSKCRSVLKTFGLSIKRTYDYSPNTFFVTAKEGFGAERVFALGEKLLQHKDVLVAHPELVRERSLRAAAPQQWHLKKTKINGKTVDAHANVEKAWDLSRGKGIKICVIDDGVDVDHQDFSGAGKVQNGRDVTRQSNDPRPFYSANLSGEGDAHGTACAGVACANGKHGASGVAPDATLMPIRLSSGLGSQAEHDAFIWAVANGADIISCSWGPDDGAWWDADDPLHDLVTPIPDSTRLAIKYAVQNGRNGKGCVVTWAAGNGNESADNDGYASNEDVLAVAACNDRGSKSAYSDFGFAIWCSFPSDDFDTGTLPKPLTPGIWTTDRSDGEIEGYNPLYSDGDKSGKYTDNFGGTSSSCPGVAGVAALVLAQNPNLDWTEVADLIAETCDQIDSTNGDYDPDTGHSYYYGYGRVNAFKAVEKAKELL